MISTVTISTVSAVTNGAFSDSFVLIGILMLLILLVQKEFVTVSGTRLEKYSGMLNIGIAPLLMAFILIVISKVAAIIP